MLIGNVGNDPEIRYLDSNPQSPQGNAKVASFRLATTERYRDRNGETRSAPVNGRTRPATSASPPKSRPTTSSSSASAPTPPRAASPAIRASKATLVRAATKAAIPAKASSLKARAVTPPQAPHRWALPLSPPHPPTRLPALPPPPPTPRTTTCRSRLPLPVNPTQRVVQIIGPPAAFLSKCPYPRTSSTGQWSEPVISSWMAVERMRSRRAAETTK